MQVYVVLCIVYNHRINTSVFSLCAFCCLMFLNKRWNDFEVIKLFKTVLLLWLPNGGFDCRLTKTLSIMDPSSLRVGAGRKQVYSIAISPLMFNIILNHLFIA